MAKGLFVEPGFDEDRVSVIVALSSPLAAPGESSFFVRAIDSLSFFS